MGDGSWLGEGWSRWTRRGVLATAAGAAAVGIRGADGASARLAWRGSQATPVAALDPGAIVAIARDAMAPGGLRAVLLRMTVGDEVLVETALGASMTGVPATPDMRVRNGAVAIMYVATLLLRFVDRGVVGLDDPIAPWLPDLPDADRATFRMLANMTAGYPDYVPNPDFAAAFYADPFRAWREDELLAFGLAQPRRFAPGENWDYSHTNYVILGRALAAVGGAPLADLLQREVLDPLGLDQTVSSVSPAIPAPALHAFSGERRGALGIPAGTPFLEESSFWNPSWTLPHGAIQTSTVRDMAATVRAVGEGTLISPASHRAQVEPRLLGFGAPLAGCPACHTLDEQYSYGLGVVIKGSWLLQNPKFGGYAAVAGYLPARRLAVALATTFDEAAFDDRGDYRANGSMDLFLALAGALAPEDPPPV
jgi:CubicO group peptidase (beta-lactamase class C family)